LRLSVFQQLSSVQAVAAMEVVFEVRGQQLVLCEHREGDMAGVVMCFEVKLATTKEDCDRSSLIRY
jgi:hypothetical protein